MRRKSAALLLSFETRLERIMQAWLLLSGLACAVRIATAPIATGGAGLGTVAPYVLLILAPFASTVLALRWFADGDRQPQPTTRLAVIGRWRNLSAEEAARHPLFGTSGIMVSLLVGMMANVPVRAV